MSTKNLFSSESPATPTASGGRPATPTSAGGRSATKDASLTNYERTIILDLSARIKELEATLVAQRDEQRSMETRHRNELRAIESFNKRASIPQDPEEHQAALDALEERLQRKDAKLRKMKSDSSLVAILQSEVKALNVLKSKMAAMLAEKEDIVAKKDNTIDLLMMKIKQIEQERDGLKEAMNEKQEAFTNLRQGSMDAISQLQYYVKVISTAEECSKNELEKKRQELEDANSRIQKTATSLEEKIEDLLLENESLYSRLKDLEASQTSKLKFIDDSVRLQSSLSDAEKQVADGKRELAKLSKDLLASEAGRKAALEEASRLSAVIAGIQYDKPTDCSESEVRYQEKAAENSKLKIPASDKKESQWGADMVTSNHDLEIALYECGSVGDTVSLRYEHPNEARHSQDGALRDQVAEKASNDGLREDLLLSPFEQFEIDRKSAGSPELKPQILTPTPKKVTRATIRTKAYTTENARIEAQSSSACRELEDVAASPDNEIDIDISNIASGRSQNQFEINRKSAGSPELKPQDHTPSPNKISLGCEESILH